MLEVQGMCLRIDLPREAARDLSTNLSAQYLNEALETGHHWLLSLVSKFADQLRMTFGDDFAHLGREERHACLR